MSEKNRKYVTVDGNEAAAYIAYAFTEVAAIYPITPSSPMAGKTDVWSANGKKNLFGQRVRLIEMQAESGAIAAVHGAAETGALATSFTSSQGLMLMIPTMHRIAGERLPAVLHVASRTVGSHALSIFGDHSDIYNCRATGFALLSSGDVQEVMDLAGVAHLSAISGMVPFLHFFDGFRTSHEIDKVEQMDYEDLRQMLDYKALADFRANALNPEHPMVHATVQNPDIFFQVREANNGDYESLPDIVEAYMQKVNAVTGRDYHLFNYYGAPDADRVIIAMGSVSGCIREVVDFLNARGEKVGFVQVHLYRPFDVKRFIAALPETVKSIAVLDRTKEMGATGDPLYLDICAALRGRADLTVVGGRYGLSSKDTTPSQIAAVFANLCLSKPIDSFSIGIVDDVTFRSLPEAEEIHPEDAGTVSCKFWGLGGDGTVGANKNTVEIINSHTGKFGQAYFEYDAKKSFGITKSHLRFGDQPIRSSYYVKSADFVACHNPTYIGKYDIAGEVKPGGTLLINCPWDAAELEKQLPAKAKRDIARKGLKLYTIDATKIAQDLGLGSHSNTVLQAAFFALMPVIPVEEAVGYMKAAATKTYFKKGEEVVARNLAAIDAGVSAPVQVEIPELWQFAVEAPKPPRAVPEVVTEILDPLNAQKGDDLPVSKLMRYKNGIMDMGLTAYEKRRIATRVPVWDADKCIQCNKCAYVCPHAVVRPYLLTEAERFLAPADMKYAHAKGKPVEDLYFTMQISEDDCTGCGSCANVCPAKEKALTMAPIDEAKDTSASWNYALNLPDKKDYFDPYTVKGSQFRRPLLEFSAACAGCGETPYAKLLTQLYGDRVYWANATGCSQAWGSAMPGIPYTKNQKGHGPAWTNSLFENNAEFALGMVLSVNQQREAVKLKVQDLRNLLTGENEVIPGAEAAESDFAAASAAMNASANAARSLSVSEAVLLEACDKWLAAFDDFDGSQAAGEKLTEALEAEELLLRGRLSLEGGVAATLLLRDAADQALAGSLKETLGRGAADLFSAVIGHRNAVEEKIASALEIEDEPVENAFAKAELIHEILAAKDQLAKKTFWMYGGDGWAYDIGFGGLDHVLASGENVNVLVVDTEVYSNTGGQSSKATPVGAVAQFAASGKKSPKKDLGSILMTYGNIYVAQVAQGADNAQLVKAVKEAQEYNGPSMIIAYAPCQEHGLKCGAAKVQDEMKKAVDAGYWFLYRYNPDATPKFQLDSKAPSIAYEEFLDGEVRYASLRRTFPENAETLFAEGARLSKERYEKLAAMKEDH